jgi:cytochrome c
MHKHNHINGRQVLLQGTTSAIATLFACSPLTTTLSAGDVDGKALFEKRCTGCHAVNADHEGPCLQGVVGRRAGVVQIFEYSKAVQSAQFTWDADLLEKWLADPDALVPGTDMTFRVPKSEERPEIIAYLKTLTP